MEKQILRFFITIFIHWLAYLHLTAQSEFHYMDSFGKQQGIISAPVCMVEDKHGFIWVGTGKGLLRLDGASAVAVDIFTDVKQNNCSIMALGYDEKEDLLYVGTRDGLLKYHLPSGESWKMDPLDYFPKEKIFRQKSHTAYQDRQGDWWFDFQIHGLVRFPANGEKPQQFSIETLSPDQDINQENLVKANTVVGVAQDLFQDSIIWAGTRYGLLRINKVAETVRPIFYHPQDQRAHIASNSMRHIYPHPNGKLYISTWNGGMLEFDPATEQFNQFFISQKGFDREDLTNQVEKVFARNDRELYVSSTGRKEDLYVFNLQTRQMSLLKENIGVDFIDLSGNLWNRTANGLQLFHRQRNNIERHYFPEEVSRDVVKIRTIRDFEGNGKVLLKNKGVGGLLEFDRRTERWDLLSIPGKSNSLVDGYILEKTPAGILTNDLEVLYLLRPGKREFEELPYRLPINTARLFASSSKDGSVFISSMNNQFFWLKPGLNEMVTYNLLEIKEPFPGYFSEAKVSPPDKFGRPWLTTAGGYSIFDPVGNRFLHFLYRDLPDKFFPENIDLWPDSFGKMWCNSSNVIGWIDQEHPEQGLQQRYDHSTGFDFKDVWYPKPDTSGRIWFIAQQGLVCLDQHTKEVIPLGIYASTIDPLPNNEMAIALANGFGIISTDSLPAKRSIPRPYLSSFKVFENERLGGGDLFAQNPILLESDENTFSVGFSVHSFFLPGQFKLAYQLKGVDRDWVYPDVSVRSTAYSNLTGGDYVFRLKASDAMDKWGEPFEMHIHVATVWYKTTFAYLFFLVLAVLAIWSVFLFQKRRYALIARLEAEHVEALRLKELDHFKNRFFTNITHEFRTPLTVILGLAETLRKNNVSDSKEAIQMIENNGQNLLDLVNQMLDLAKLESGNLKVQVLQADVMLFLKITVEAFNSLTVTKKQNLSFYGDPEIFNMDFDPKRLRGIISNLMTNAIKFTPEYGSIMVVAKNIKDNLEVSVKDTGSGILEGEIEKVFDRFFQTDNSLHQSLGGTGVGLALTKELVELMGGSIEVSSRQGEGSTFKFRLPVKNNAPFEDWEKSIEISKVSTGLKQEDDLLPLKDFYENRPILLVIEDNADLLRYLASLLQDKYHLLIARNGREGLLKAFEFLPDVVLSDVMMPEMDGLEVCNILKNDERTSHIPVILLTAKITDEDRLKGLIRGADAYLEKPFNQEELFVELKKSVDLRKNLINYFSKNKEGATPDDSQDSKLLIEDAFIQKVRHFIEKHISDESYNITLLCRELGMSRSQLHRKLTALTGSSATYYIRAIRLDHAKELLATTDLTISEIAYQVGFKDPNYFSRIFTETFGTSPSETRK
jgi:signal transduction histidine kinase/DNA-binding response OmpR family regulator